MIFKKNLSDMDVLRNSKTRRGLAFSTENFMQLLTLIHQDSAIRQIILTLAQNADMSDQIEYVHNTGRRGKHA